jgi:hypothetical protein
LAARGVVEGNCSQLGNGLREFLLGDSEVHDRIGEIRRRWINNQGVIAGTKTDRSPSVDWRQMITLS